MSTRCTLATPLFLALLLTVLLGENSQADQINWRNSLNEAQIEATRTGKLVLVHFYTASCGPCKKLERDVFSQPQIAAAIERDYVPVKLNADESPAQANRFQIQRVPSEVVLNAQGNVLQKLSCPLEPNAYGSQLVNVAQHYQQRSANRTASAQAPINSAYAGLKIGQRQPANTPLTKAVANTTPPAPAITQNPYVNAAPPAVPKTAPVPVVQQRLAAPAVPANAMPKSYRNRYAAVTAQNLPNAKLPNAKPPAVQAPDLSAPSAPQVAAITPAAVAPKIAQTKTPPAVTTAKPTEQQVAATPPATAAQPVAADVWPPKLPANTPPLAFEGYCPVSLQQAQKWVRGNKTFGAIHRGRTFLFASSSLRQKFIASPDAYSPVFSGYDPVKMLDENKQIAGIRKFGFEYRGAFYLFSSKETMTRFASKPDHYSAGVRQAMNRMDATTGGTIRR